MNEKNSVCPHKELVDFLIKKEIEIRRQEAIAHKDDYEVELLAHLEEFLLMDLDDAIALQKKQLDIRKRLVQVMTAQKIE